MKQTNYRIFCLLSATLTFFLSLWPTTYWPVQTGLFLTYIVFSNRIIARHFDQTNKAISLVLSFFLHIALTIMAVTPIYWFFGFEQKMFSMIFLVLPFVIDGFFERYSSGSSGKSEASLVNPSISKLNFSHLIQIRFETVLITSARLIGLFLLLFMLRRTSTDTLISPWTLFGPKFFGLSAIFFLCLSIYKLFFQRKLRYLDQVLIAALFTLPVFLVFKLGYGYDQFIHQAAERYILENGQILPKTPYYLGQYNLVLIFSKLSGIGHTMIDRALVPLFCAFSLPVLAGIFRFQKFLKIDPVFPMMILGLPALFLVSTPYNLALLLGPISIILFIFGSKTQTVRLTSLTLAGATIMVHAMVGLPVILITLFLTSKNQLKKHIKIKKLLNTLFALLIAFLIPVIFVILFGAEIKSWPDTLISIKNSLVKIPEYYFFQGAPFYLQALYTFEIALPYAYLTLVLIGFPAKKSDIFHLRQLYLACLLTLVSGIILAFWIRPALLPGYEQSSYGQRLITLSMFLFLPFTLRGLSRIKELVQKYCEKFNYPKYLKKSIKILGCIILALILTASFYLIPPTRDALAKSTGYSPRTADLKAVELIDKINAGNTDYIVLTNQAVGASAIKYHGFKRYHETTSGTVEYFYSIPAGGPLYRYYAKMVYENQAREHMSEAMRFAGVRKAYFVHTNYWYPAATIRDGAKKTADRWWELDGARIWIFEYNL